MATSNFSADAFDPVDQHQQTHGITRPSRSYWQDAWIRLKANRRALYSLYLITGLVIFTFAGPMVWQVNPDLQDVDQISQPPGADRTVTLVEPFQPWYGNPTTPGEGLRFAGPATTQGVQLQWDPIPGASGYRIYRNIYPVGAEKAYGLPLKENRADQTYFQDRLDLKPQTYFYSVVALNAAGEELPNALSLAGQLTRVITANEARRRNLLLPDEPAISGDTLTLALHPLGTDYLGRDMLSRLMHGARVSLFIGFFAPILFVLFGVAYGSAAGFMGGVSDQVLMRFADFVVALPFLLFMILFKVIFAVGPGESGIAPMLVAMVLLLWPATARLVRGQVLQIREEGYIDASRLLGAKTHYLIMRHMIPNTMGVILVTLTFAVPSAIFTEAFLSFIGMGVAPPTPSWGSMCNEGIKTMLTTPHELFFPALFISATVLAFNLLGDGLRDALDARMRNRD
ncbi:MAG: ABC transporter permease [Gammaproteobacteria bacterium]|nr:ABC transporter permease [Gammaproteobacteria bacterium]